MTFSVNFDYR